MKKFSSFSIPTFGLLVLFAFWEVSIVIFSFPHWILPAPSKIFVALWQRWDLVVFHSTQTILEALIGLGVAIVIGVGIRWEM